MAEHTAIEWCDHTWSPVWGCTQVSKAETGGGGCDNCYAMTLAHRFGTGWNGAPMREFGEHHWNEPVRWNKRAAASDQRPKVFPSMCDPLDKDWPDGVRERFWRLVDATPYLTWLILTKRIGNAERLGPGAVIGRWPTNVWMGATVVNQAEADRDIPKLLATPARVRFLSMEPLLGAVDLTRLPHAGDGAGDALAGEAWVEHWLDDEGAQRRRERVGNFGRIDWVICGGESGPLARPMHPTWARNLRDQCAAARVPFLFKQWGDWLPGHQYTVEHQRRDPDEAQSRFECAQCANPTAALADDQQWEYGYDLSVDTWDEHSMYRVGKKAAGRLLDGVEHNGFPEVR